MGKHSKSKHFSDEKGVGKGKKVVAIIIILLLIVTIAFGIYFLVNKITEQNRIKASVNEFFEGLKNSEVDKVNKYADYNQLINSFDEMILQDENDRIEKELFSSLEWNIETIEKIDNRTEIIIEAKNKDFKDVITNWMKELVSAKSAGISITNEYALEKLENEIKEEEKTKTVIKKIVLKEDNGNFKITVSEDLRDLVFPGIDSVIDVLSNN